MNSRLIAVTLMVLTLAACDREQESASDERATPVTAAEVRSEPVERVETSIGRLRANTAPAVSAETGGRIAAILVDAGDEVEAGEVLARIEPEVQQISVNSARAEVRRLEALLENEGRRVERLSDLARQQSVAQDQLDEARTAVESLQAQLEAARSRLADAEYNLRQTQVLSPVSGSVQARLVSDGDYVSAGTRLFELVSTQALRAFLPLPEHLQDYVEIGQPVRLAIPARPDEQVAAEVTDLRPAVGEASRAIELIVDLDNPGHWRPGGSVTAEVILERHEGLVVPPAAVVRRPGGTVVYVVDGDRARERVVNTGLTGSGWIEIVEGIEAGETVVVDGAGFLTDGARIAVDSHGDAS